MPDDRLYLPDDRYLAALRRQRDRIAAGVPLVCVDDDTVGNKVTSCSWGLCSDDAEAWPEAEDHLWPERFCREGRVAPRYLQTHQPCPFDTRAPEGGPGCFHACRVFQRKYRTPDREAALALYDVTISAAAARSTQS